MVESTGWLSYHQVPDAIRRRHLGCFMTSRFQIVCDSCGATAVDDMTGWAHVDIASGGRSIDPRRGKEFTDFCPECWRAMRVIARERKKSVKKA